MRKWLMVGLMNMLMVAQAFAINVATWNVTRFGEDGTKDVPALAAIAKRYDFLALQEVMSEEAAGQLERQLEFQTGVPWTSLASDPIGRGSYKERYVFIWRTDKVAYADGAVVYLDSRDVFAREPFSARFLAKDTGQHFVAASMHSIWGNSVSRREKEAQALAGYWQWLDSTYDKTPTKLLMGDFNLAPNSSAWEPLKAFAQPAITRGGTTLGYQNGKFVSLYDNIWVPASAARNSIEAAVLNYPPLLGISNKVARDTVADHAPIGLRLESLRINEPARAGAASPQTLRIPQKELDALIQRDTAHAAAQRIWRLMR